MLYIQSKLWMLRLAMVASIHVALYAQFYSVYLNPNYTWELFFFFFWWRCDPTRVMASSFLRFLDHTQRTAGRTPLNEWSAHRRDLYLTTHNTHNRQTPMPPVGFEPTISAGERPQTYILDHAATGTSIHVTLHDHFSSKYLSPKYITDSHTRHITNTGTRSTLDWETHYTTEHIVPRE